MADPQLRDGSNSATFPSRKFIEWWTGEDGWAQVWQATMHPKPTVDTWRHLAASIFFAGMAAQRALDEEKPRS